MELKSSAKNEPVRRNLSPIIALIFLCGTFTACFKAPVELQQAIRKQHEEINQVKAFYNDAIQKLFDQIEELQLHYIDQFETAMIDKYKFKRGENPGTAASDDDLNVVLVPIQARVHSFADERRAKVRENISSMRKQYLSLNESIENIDRINQDLGVYIDSLIRYKKAQDALGQAMLQKVNSVVPVTLPAAAAVGKLLKVFESEFAKAVEAPTRPSSQR